MDDTVDLASAIQVIGVLLIPIVLLVDSWLADSLKYAGEKVTGDTSAKDDIRLNTKRLWPRILSLSAACIVLALLMLRVFLSLRYVGVLRYQVIPTAWALLSTVLWLSGLGLAVLAARLVNKRLKARA